MTPINSVIAQLTLFHPKLVILSEGAAEPKDLWFSRAATSQKTQSQSLTQSQVPGAPSFAVSWRRVGSQLLAPSQVQA